MAKEEYPKALHHPQFRKGKITPIETKYPGGKIVTDYQGESDMFPAVTVNNEQQEAFYRAKGYLMHGEVPPAPADYSEYPVMLSHPDHADAIPDDFDIKKGPSGEVISTRIPGRPEKFPAVMAKTPAEEETWAKKGYARIGVADGDASQRAKASPYDPDYKVSEYPKVVDGKIVDPHASIDHNRYPMYVGDMLVNSPQEEAEARGTAVDAAVLPAEKCIICGEPIVSSDGGWGNGAAGPFHLSHMAQQAEAPAAAKSPDRSERGRKAAETRRLKKERAGQAAPLGG